MSKFVDLLSFFWKLLQYIFVHILLILFFFMALVISLGVFASFSLIFAGVPINIVQFFVGIIPVDRNIDFLWFKIGFLDIPFMILYLVFYFYLVFKFLFTIPFFLIGSAFQILKEAWIDTYNDFF